MIPVRQIASAQIPDPVSGRFKIRNLEQLLNGESLTQGLHKHDFYFILFLSKGNGVHEIDFVGYEIQDHSIFILRPGQAHKLFLASNSSGYLMQFDRGFYHPESSTAAQRWRRALSKNHCSLEAVSFEKLYIQLGQLFHEYTSKEDGYLEAITAYLDLFFIEVVRQTNNPGTADTTTSYAQERFEEFALLLETNITRLKNVSEYAALLNLSSYQLNSISKAAVGKTVSALINEQIILEAKRNLLATSIQVKELADLLGYEDVSYFIRFFKKQTGSSPETFRKNFR